MQWREIVKFGIAGGVNVILTFTAYALMVAKGLAYPFANLLAWTLGIVCAYFLNLLFVFGNKQRPLRGSTRQFAIFIAIYGINFGISSLVLIGLVESTLVGPVCAQFVAIPVAVILNYTSSKFLIFSRANSIKPI